jgi:hypothetical protein
MRVFHLSVIHTLSFHKDRYTCLQKISWQSRIVGKVWTNALPKCIRIAVKARIKKIPTKNDSKWLKFQGWWVREFYIHLLSSSTPTRTHCTFPHPGWKIGLLDPIRSYLNPVCRPTSGSLVLESDRILKEPIKIRSVSLSNSFTWRPAPRNSAYEHMFDYSIDILRCRLCEIFYRSFSTFLHHTIFESIMKMFNILTLWSMHSMHATSLRGLSNALFFIYIWERERESSDFSAYY